MLQQYKNIFYFHLLYNNLKNLSTIGGKKFSKELIALGKISYRKIIKGDWEPNKVLKNRYVLIIGPGLSVLKYKLIGVIIVKRKDPKTNKDIQL